MRNRSVPHPGAQPMPCRTVWARGSLFGCSALHEFFDRGRFSHFGVVARLYMEVTFVG